MGTIYVAPWYGCGPYHSRPDGQPATEPTSPQTRASPVPGVSCCEFSRHPAHRSSRRRPQGPCKATEDRPPTPIYPNGAQAISPVAPSPPPLSPRGPSGSIGGSGLTMLGEVAPVHHPYRLKALQLGTQILLQPPYDRAIVPAVLGMVLVFPGCGAQVKIDSYTRRQPPAPQLGQTCSPGGTEWKHLGHRPLRTLDPGEGGLFACEDPGGDC